MIRAFFFLVMWFAVGAGIQGAFVKNHNKTLPDDPKVVMIGAFLWPAYVAADVYFAIGPKSGEKGVAQ